jgi:hypothetical protein
MSPPPDLDTLSPTELKSLVLALLARVTELERVVVSQRDEIARLKGMPGRPTIKPSSKPSGMENATQPKPPGGKGKGGRRGRKRTACRVIHEDRVIEALAVPSGSRFKGYEDFVVQDLVFHPHVVRYRRAR